MEDLNKSLERCRIILVYVYDDNSCEVERMFRSKTREYELLMSIINSGWSTIFKHFIDL